MKGTWRQNSIVAYDLNELSKQAEGMEERNAKRVVHLNKTGKFVYDIDEDDE